ncbi:amidase [Niallia circulans]|jgi:amidase|uniref:Amidase n=1 Tax=Niallia circulans TaxID=1397 RepID=A0A0J1I7E1_NIACI|nr:amidase [Niallia circulans]KLV21921.1 amidase [Niallia circulans]MED5103322.1 amidase [Niallia circulans]PAD86738.1 amidase [Niallia circulans]
MSDFGAYIDKNISLKPIKRGNLDGLTFAVKDVFTIKDYLSSAGNPDWLSSHPPAKETAPVITSLLNNGARLQGTTITDELMYSLNGENFHYGTPVNPKSPNRIPGGSSSGSAVTVAAKQTDFSLGTDTGGSIRIPSSYCGIYGIRPSHGVVNIEGVIPLAKSFDTVGWMANDAEILNEVGKVLLPVQRDGSFTRFIMGSDAWALADQEVHKAFAPLLEKLEQSVPNYVTTVIAEEGLQEWSEVFRMLQGREIWQEHGEWIQKAKPTFGPGIAERFKWASTIKDEDLAPYHQLRRKIQQRMEELLKDDAVLIIPTAPGIAPLLNLPVYELEERRKQTFQLCCIAGLTGFPQVNIPLTTSNGVPVGLSFIAGRNQDRNLLQLVAEWVKKW